MSEPLVFNSISAARWSRIQAAAVSELGTSIVGDGSVASIHKDGFTVGFTAKYDPQAETLTFTVLHKSMLLSDARIDSELTAAINGVQ